MFGNRKKEEGRYPIRELPPAEFPALLAEIPDPPERLFVRGTLPTGKDDATLKYLCVVGSRKYSRYGKEACETLVAGLRGYPVVIVSGLALGIDSIAHCAALEADLRTIALPGSGLGWNALHPSSHRYLAREILERGGALVSEFEEDFKATRFSFPQRNRIMAGMSHATLVIEAERRSGTLITSRLATEYNRDVFTVPHPIFSAGGEGPHLLLSLGATPIRRGGDILDALGFKRTDERSNECLLEGLSENEKRVAVLLKNPLPRDELVAHLDMPVSEVNVLLSAMELKGLITETMGELRLQ